MAGSKLLGANLLALAATAVAFVPRAEARTVHVKHWVVEYRQPQWQVKQFTRSLDGTDHRDAEGEARRFLDAKQKAGYEAYMDQHTAAALYVSYDVHYRLPDWTVFFRYGDKATDKVKAINAQFRLSQMGYEARVRFVDEVVRIPETPVGPRAD